MTEETCHSNSCCHVGSLVGKPVPDFTAAAVMGDNCIRENFNLKDYLGGHYGWIFFYPLDFTFVCPSEIIAHDNRQKDFEERNTRLVTISVDSHYTHLAWKEKPRKEGGVGKISFPMVSDLTKEISRKFGVLTKDSVALRGSFLVDRDGIVRHQLINDLPLGRDVDESLRMIDALQFHEENGDVCPAGWQKGKPGMKETPEGVADYLGREAENL